MNDKTYTLKQIEEAFAAMRRDIDSDYAGTENDSERGQFFIGSVETDVLAYLKGDALWMVYQDEAAQKAYRETAGISEEQFRHAVAEFPDQGDEDNLFYGRDVDAAVARYGR